MRSLYEPGSCLVCGDETRTPSNNACGLGCSKVLGGWTRRKRRIYAKRRQCAWCEEWFVPRQGVCETRGEGRYCGYDCKSAAQHWGDVPEGPKAKEAAEEEARGRQEAYERLLAEGFECAGCGERHEARSVNQKWCSSCARDRVREAGFRKWRASGKYQGQAYNTCHKTITCEDCGSGFRGHRPAKRCPDCARAAMPNGGSRVPITYLLKRDGGRCQLCRRKVKRDAPYPHPRSPTVDHIVPRSRGGEDTKRNTHLACWECNRTKGNGSLGGQLLCVG